jgi:hypothetical protein
MCSPVWPSSIVNILFVLFCFEETAVIIYSCFILFLQSHLRVYAGVFPCNGPQFLRYLCNFDSVACKTAH